MLKTVLFKDSQNDVTLKGSTPKLNSWIYTKRISHEISIQILLKETRKLNKFLPSHLYD